ncbi:MAG TPA: hypothetical protein VGY99_22520 [Candidatus Binataceae bacterium]|nr:hypothetical protein [Candidatus Binataceae bacterium]
MGAKLLNRYALRDTFAAIELLNAALDLCANRLEFPFSKLVALV